MNGAQQCLEWSQAWRFPLIYMLIRGVEVVLQRWQWQKVAMVDVKNSHCQHPRTTKHHLIDLTNSKRGRKEAGFFRLHSCF